MPPSRTQSRLVAKYGDKGRQAVQNHAGDTTDYGFLRLPGGITNGVARLVRCYYDEYKKQYLPGEMYMRAVGVVVSPETVDVDGQEVPVRGLQTSIMIPVCDVPGSGNRAGVSQDQNIAQILNEYRKLGFDTTHSSLETLEDDAALLQDAAPYFRFSTSWGKDKITGKEDRSKVWENWYGNKGLENYQDPHAGDGVEDNTQQVPPPKSSPAMNGVVTTQRPAPPPQKVRQTTLPVSEPEPHYRDDHDVDSLAVRADMGDDEAIRDLTAMAESTLDQTTLKKFHDTPTYAAGVKLMKVPATPAKVPPTGKKSPAPKPAPAPELAEGEWSPQEGELYDVRIGKTVFEGLVKAVDPDAKTMDVQNTKTKKVISGVSWDNIVTEE